MKDIHKMKMTVIVMDWCFFRRILGAFNHCFLIQWGDSLRPEHQVYPLVIG